MMRFVPLFLVCILFPAIQATQLTKCEVYRAVEDMDGFEGISALECELITLPLASSGSSALSPQRHPLPVSSAFTQSSPCRRLALLPLFRFSFIQGVFLSFLSPFVIKILRTSLLSETGCEVFVFCRESSPSVTLLLQIFAKHLSSLSLRDLRYISQQWL